MSNSNYLVYRGEIILKELEEDYQRVIQCSSGTTLCNDNKLAIKAIKERMIQVERGLELIKMGKY